MQYYFMNKDTKLLAFSVRHSLGDIIIEEDERYTDILPIGYVDISLWLENRNYAKHKDSLKMYLKTWGMDNVEGFIEITHCLGLNDTLWVKEVHSPLNWADVSLYTNDFSDVMEKIAFGTGVNGLDISSTDFTSPEFVSPGSFAKCWKREADGIYLYKTTGSLSQGFEPYSEYFASQIAEKFDIPTVSYELTTFNNKICTRCKMFTSEKVGLASFAEVFDVSQKKYNIPAIVDACEKLGFGNEIRQMYLLDCLILNQDRHLGNIGFLFDNNTFEIIGMSPIYDFNISMLCNAYPENMLTTHRIDEYIQEMNIGPKASEASFFDLARGLELPIPEVLDFEQDERWPMDTARFKMLKEYIKLNHRRILTGNNDLERISAPKNNRNLAQYLDGIDFSRKDDQLIITIKKADFVNNEYLADYGTMYGLSDDEKIVITVTRDKSVDCVIVDSDGEYEVGDELLGDKRAFLTEISDRYMHVTK